MPSKMAARCFWQHQAALLLITWTQSYQSTKILRVPRTTFVIGTALMPSTAHQVCMQAVSALVVMPKQVRLNVRGLHVYPFDQCPDVSLVCARASHLRMKSHILTVAAINHILGFAPSAGLINPSYPTGWGRQFLSLFQRELAGMTRNPFDVAAR